MEPTVWAGFWRGRAIEWLQCTRLQRNLQEWLHEASDEGCRGVSLEPEAPLSGFAADLRPAGSAGEALR